MKRREKDMCGVVVLSVKVVKSETKFAQKPCLVRAVLDDLG